MYKILLRKNPKAAVDYFLQEKNLSADEKTGFWIGGGARELNLVEMTPDGSPTTIPKVVSAPDLEAALHGYAPPSSSRAGFALNGRYPTKEGVRRCAWDCVLSPHKSLSIVAMCLAPKYDQVARVIKRAIMDACRDTFAVMEALAEKQNGSSGGTLRGSLLAAIFTHLTSRRDDPQVHSHLLVMNTVYNPYRKSPRSWYGLESSPYYRFAREIDMIYQRELFRHVVSNGVEARLVKIDNLPTAVLPAVPASTCSRLSKGHISILASVGKRWKREQRTLLQKRAENLINDQNRPGKKTLLVDREAILRDALTDKELVQIIRNLSQPPVIPKKMRGPLTARMIYNAVQTGVHVLEDYPLTLRIRLLAAFYGSMSYLHMPFQQFFVAGFTVKGVHAMPSADSLEGKLIDHVVQKAVFEELEEHFAKKIKVPSVLLHPQSVDTLSVASFPRVDGISRLPSVIVEDRRKQSTDVHPLPGYYPESLTENEGPSL